MRDQTDKNVQDASKLLAMYEQIDKPPVTQEWGKSYAKLPTSYSNQPTSALNCDKALRLMELLIEMYELVNVLYPNCHSNQGDTALDSPSLPITPTR